uniref:Tripartite motif-containing protein 16-like n=1 Tax=Erpetoichthys calabaricus TaxID=27687 RepID=A0A8C4TC20_ERPCA
MAKAQLFASQDEMTCSLCLEALSDPVSILCGHSFCHKCLTDYWDQRQECSCPQCGRTTQLSSVSELCRSLERPQKICAKHQKSLEMFCEADGTCICVMCSETEHEGHKMVMIREQVTREVKAERVMERLEKEMKEQKKRDADLRELSETKEHNCILQVRRHFIGYLIRLGWNKKVTCDKNRKNGYPSNPDNFSKLEQILCNEALTGTHCYWEVECTGESVEIGVTYNIEDIDYENFKDLLGYNDMSWCLWCFRSQYFACHDKMQTVIHSPYSPRIGVYLDWPAGSLSFYRVSLTMTLLHRFNTTFTKPLYPVFYLYHGTSVKICNLMP